MIVVGTVDQGQGWAKHLLRDAVFLVLGTLHPGTLNIFVSAPPASDLASGPHPFFRKEDETLTPDDIRARGVIPFRWCTVNGQPGLILRTAHPGVAYSAPRVEKPTILPQPNTMFEVVTFQLVPGIGYGSQVQLEFDPTEPLGQMKIR